LRHKKGDGSKMDINVLLENFSKVGWVAVIPTMIPAINFMLNNFDVTLVEKRLLPNNKKFLVEIGRVLSIALIYSLILTAIWGWQNIPTNNQSALKNEVSEEKVIKDNKAEKESAKSTDSKEIVGKSNERKDNSKSNTPKNVLYYYANALLTVFILSLVLLLFIVLIVYVIVKIISYLLIIKCVFYIEDTSNNNELWKIVRRVDKNFVLISRNTKVGTDQRIEYKYYEVEKLRNSIIKQEFIIRDNWYHKKLKNVKEWLINLLPLLSVIIAVILVASKIRFYLYLLFIDALVFIVLVILKENYKILTGKFD
jgi:uncharacterized membrane protein